MHSYNGPSLMLGGIGYTGYTKWIVIATSQHYSLMGKKDNTMANDNQEEQIKSHLDLKSQEMLPTRSDI